LLSSEDKFIIFARKNFIENKGKKGRLVEVNLKSVRE